MRITCAVILLCLSMQSQAVPASSESVEALLIMTETEATIVSIYVSAEKMMRQGIDQTFQGKSLNAQQRQIIEAVPAKFVALMRQEISWEKMKPQYIRLYQETFQQDEIDGLNAFYASPAGQAFVKKMPIVMQKVMALSAPMMQSIMPKMKAAMDDALREVKLAK